MGRGWWVRLGVLAVCALGSVAYLVPTVFNLDPKSSSFPVKRKINLGLDLQGGLYMVMGVEFAKLYDEVLDRQARELVNRLKAKGAEARSLEKVAQHPEGDPRVSLQFDAAQKAAIQGLIDSEFSTLRVVEESKDKVILGLSFTYLSDLKSKTLEQSIEVIRNRIDEFGVSEPGISSQGGDKVLVELPGVKDVARAKELIGRTARLEYRLVEHSLSPAALGGLVADAEKAGVRFDGSSELSSYVSRLNAHLKGKLPAGTIVAFSKDESKELVPYLLRSEASVTGDDLQDAHVQVNPETRRPEVVFTLNPRGAVVFRDVTRENKGRQLAIVLDSIVHSAPVIQSEIPEGRGSITLGTGDPDKLFREANDLSIVLRAGALPAELKFLEERVVGPTLGQDSIQKGTLASLIGALAVFMLMIFYYRVSGVIAVVSLILNVLFVYAIMVGLEATLTLPGIAGIGLTVGIAVDSNVVIYERIREELRLGKIPRMAVSAGFQKAFSTILDANVTNAFAAIILLTFGTGPIKGFAVTMLIGIVTTLFSAVFVCRMLFDLYLNKIERRGVQTLSV